MLERFLVDNNRLAESLSRQSIVQGSAEIVAGLIGIAKLHSVDAGTVLIEQDNSDDSMYFILAGSFAVLVNGREIARRGAERQVGEVSLVDPKNRRSATVVALEDSVVAEVSESDFSLLADRFPSLWKKIAADLAGRLVQRNELVRQRNDVPRVFVGSSKEGIVIANAVQAGLAHDPFIVTVWTNGVFGPSEFPIEALERIAVESDFAIIILGPDDRIISRDREDFAPRDNVVLEVGLFIGAVGRRRVFMLVPQNVDLKMPTDVLGVTTIRYLTDDTIEPARRIGHACDEIRGAIIRQGPR